MRIIEYTVTVEDSSGGTRTEPFRLVTTLLDHEQAPAAQVAAVYHQRWEIENSYGELKTRLRGASFILRSRSPELVCQELFAFLTVYQALCALKTEAARTAGIDPDRISFTVTVRIARDHASASSPRQASPRHAARPSATSSAISCPGAGTGSANASRNRRRTPSRPRNATRPACAGKVKYKIK